MAPHFASSRLPYRNEESMVSGEPKCPFGEGVLQPDWTVDPFLQTLVPSRRPTLTAMNRAAIFNYNSPDRYRMERMSVLREPCAQMSPILEEMPANCNCHLNKDAMTQLFIQLDHFDGRSVNAITQSETWLEPHAGPRTQHKGKR